MNITKEQVLHALKNVEGPDLEKDVVTLGMIKNLKVEGKNVSFTVVLSTPSNPVKELIHKACVNAILHYIDQDANVNVKMTVLTEVYTEMTPNPFTMKFVLNFLLVEEEGQSIEFRTKEKSKVSPIANKLFDFPFVHGVFITSNFITVTKDESCEWYEVIPEIKDLIKTQLSTGEPLLTGEIITEVSEEPVNISGDIEQKIMSLLDEYVRPAVEDDGGAIDFKSFENGTVTVTLKGSCHGCPSTNTTLKQGVETLLRRMLPEVDSVITETVML